jgi:para-nitrobenzyl esterase
MLDALLGPALRELGQAPDSFSVRIQAPADADRLPVLLFVHGGGFTTGSGEARWYDAHDLVRHGLVLVTVNYRLGAFGVLGGAADSAPRSLSDLETAARWVRDNIVAFGGDPERVTIAGDSAGAWYAHALSLLPETRGLFARTVLVSLPRLEPLSAADDDARTTAFADALAPEILATAPVDAVLAAQRATAQSYRGEGFAFAPAAGAGAPSWWGQPRVSATHLHTSALLLLTTAAESAAFLRSEPEESFTRERLHEVVHRRFRDPAAVLAHLSDRPSLYEQTVAATTLWQFQSVAYGLATHAAIPTRLVRLDLRSRLPRAFSPHCWTLPFLFGDRNGWRDAPMLDGLATDVFERTRATFRDVVVPFVRDGSGSAPRWDPSQPRLLAVGEAGASAVAPGDLHLPVAGDG